MCKPANSLPKNSPHKVVVLFHVSYRRNKFQRQWKYQTKKNNRTTSNDNSNKTDNHATNNFFTHIHQQNCCVQKPWLKVLMFLVLNSVQEIRTTLKINIDYWTGRF